MKLHARIRWVKTLLPAKRFKRLTWSDRKGWWRGVQVVLWRGRTTQGGIELVSMRRRPFDRWQRQLQLTIGRAAQPFQARREP